MTGSLALSPLYGRRDRLLPVVMASLLVHAALITLALFERPQPIVNLDQKPIVAKLVRLGEKRPEHFLPRKEAAPPPPAAEPSPAPPAPAPTPPAPAAKAAPAPAPSRMAVPTPAKKPPPAAKPRPSPPSSRPPSGSPRTDVLASALSKVRRDQALSGPVYGDPNGDPRGDASEATAGDEYLALVERTLRDTYTLPSTISERDRLHLKATVLLYIDADGRVLRHEFESRSGNGAFDAALDRAIRAARLPPPPAPMRAKYRTEGLGVVYRP